MMLGSFAKAVAFAAALTAATHVDAQSRRVRAPRQSRQAEHPTVTAPSVDRRDSVVAAPGPFKGHPYWLALAQCGGIYFQLNVLYTDDAVRARTVKPDPKLNAEDTRKLKEAIQTATAYFDAAVSFLMTDRGMERDEAVLTYDPQGRAAGDREKTIDAALAAAQACPALYRACQVAYPKACNEALAPIK